MSQQNALQFSVAKTATVLHFLDMHISILAVATREKNEAAIALAAQYEQRLRQYTECSSQLVPTESKLLEKTAAHSGRTRPVLILLDAGGRTMSSEELAAWIGRMRDRGTQHLQFAIGPANGWSKESRDRANLLLSFGPMTFPHELARVMLVEQLYRAFTILAGHPYHGGH
jgi:23S rRNA (pseudouridine1915-N3)-methyltransferase